MSTEEKFAQLREGLGHGLRSFNTFVEMIDLVAAWPEDDGKDLAIEYLTTHLLGQPSEENWFRLLKMWRHAFGNEDVWPRGERYERAKNPRLQEIAAALLLQLDQWPGEFKVFSRRRIGHPLWPTARTLRLLHMEKFTHAEGCNDIEHVVIRRDKLLQGQGWHVLKYFESLSKITMRLSGARQLQNLGQITQLQELDLGMCYQLETLQGFEQLTQLEILDLSQCEKLVDVSALKHLPNLRWLNLGQCRSLTVLPEQPLMETRDAVAAYQQTLPD